MEQHIDIKDIVRNGVTGKFPLHLVNEIVEAVTASLQKNNVIVFPCMPGDKAYFVIEDIDETYVSEETITDVCTRGFFTGGDNDFTYYESVGKLVFFEKEKAEKEAAERNEKK